MDTVIKTIGDVSVVAFVSLCVAILSVSILIRAVARKRVKVLDRNRPSLGILSTFRWFLGKENRDIVDVVARDLRLDAREMNQQGQRPWSISLVITRHSISVVSAILLDGLSRLFKTMFTVPVRFWRRDD